jgi:aryl-alcohol dehydrogenase-like predicted oxidoreductase
MLNLNCKRRLVLGTASFKSDYGFGNNFKLRKKELSKIFSYCFKEKILYIDTSNKYELTNFLKYNKGLKKFKIILKINFNFQKNKNYNQLKKEIFSLVKNFLSKNQIKKLYCIMLHSENTMTSRNQIKIHNILLSLKKIKLADKIGISGYDLIKVSKIIKKFNFDILQFPYNLFDQRIADKRLLKILKKKNIELHIRSIFLQGIFFIEFNKLPVYFHKWKNFFVKLKKILIIKNLDILSLCLSHAFNLRYHKKKVIVGIKSFEHLNEIINSKIIKDVSFVKKIQSHEKKLILPYLWKIKKK